MDMLFEKMLTRIRCYGNVIILKILIDGMKKCSVNDNQILPFYIGIEFRKRKRPEIKHT